MPSPFPGMNPYLEQPGFWPDFHNSYLVRLRDAVADRLGPAYFVRLEDSVYLSAEGGRRAARRFAAADVAVGVEPAAPEPGGGVAVAEPVAAPAVGTIPALGVLRRYRWVTVRDSGNEEIVTVVELLSPANKEWTGRGRYLQKRGRVLSSRANLVEIDLLRGGERMPADDLPTSDYRVLVSRAVDRPAVAAWPVGLRDRLPAVPVPLRPGDAEPLLELQPTLHETYDRAGYARRLYRTPPDPPLAPDDAAWAAGLLAAAG